jgi:hypothetical protein
MYIYVCVFVTNGTCYTSVLTVIKPGKVHKILIFWEGVYSLSYLACTAHAPYCHLWLVMLYKILMKLQYSQRIFGKYSNIKINKNPFSGRRVSPCGRSDRRRDGQKDITKLIVAFRSFATSSTKLVKLN